jgi:hypothetical protein
VPASEVDQKMLGSAGTIKKTKYINGIGKVFLIKVMALKHSVI